MILKIILNENTRILYPYKFWQSWFETIPLYAEEDQLKRQKYQPGEYYNRNKQEDIVLQNIEATLD